ncbi:MAG: R3H domain-containing nucleic acid-binding protein [bacterium]|nr:R3H domain-containing nucleic acid-binding protein [bacterium]
MTNEEIKKTIQELLSRMEIACESVECVDEDSDRRRFSIRTPDSHLLIGPKGAHLFAFNHLVRKIAGKGEEGEFLFTVDVNDYHEAARERLHALAKVMGDRARSFKASVELEPMSSYERMVVHTFFENAGDIKTESTGDGERRRVVIKYTGE